MRPKKSLLLIDNYDSFTWNIWDYLSRIGADVHVKRREEVSAISLLKFDGIIFSPGPGNPKNIPELHNLIEKAINLKPVLGICLGFQALALYFGSNLIGGEPTHGKVHEVFVSVHGRLLNGVPSQFFATRYHSLVVKDLKFPLVELAHTGTGELMAFEHNTLPIAGVQFHPEAHLSENGLLILKNWLNLC